jgi:transcriptional regulator with XRE-family HTH domain
MQRGTTPLLLPNENLGKNIALYRKERKISQVKLAAVVGMDDNHINCIEIGQRYPSINLIARLAVALGVSIEELYSDWSNNP